MKLKTTLYPGYLPLEILPVNEHWPSVPFRKLLCILGKTHHMKQFEIKVETVAGSKGFIVKPVNTGDDSRYEIWDGTNHLFTLECCIEEDRKSLKLADEFSDKKIYPGLIQALSDVIYNSNKHDFPARNST